MKFLSSLVLILISQISFAGVTTVDSDWTTYRVDMEAGSDYSIFGGGLAGDVFHIFFDFNRAYLPYITEVNSEWQSTEFAMHTSAAGIADNATPATDDYLHFADLPLVGSFLHFEINGSVFDVTFPFALSLQNGEITGLSTGIFGALNFFGGTDTFTMSDASFSSTLEGSICGIVDTETANGGNTCHADVDVPEPGILLLMLTGLAGFVFRSAARKAVR